MCLVYIKTLGQPHSYHPWLAKYSSHLKMALLFYCLSGLICSVCCVLFTDYLGDSSGNWKAELTPFFPYSQGVPAQADVAGWWRTTASLSHGYSQRRTALRPLADAGPGRGFRPQSVFAGLAFGRKTLSRRSTEHQWTMLAHPCTPHCTCGLVLRVSPLQPASAAALLISKKTG